MAIGFSSADATKARCTRRTRGETTGLFFFWADFFWTARFLVAAGVALATGGATAATRQLSNRDKTAMQLRRPTARSTREIVPEERGIVFRKVTDEFLGKVILAAADGAAIALLVCGAAFFDVVFQSLI